MLIRLDDFGDAQLFEDKTIYSSIVLLQKKEQETFVYSNVESANNLWTGKAVEKIEEMGQSAIILTSPVVRMYYRKLTEDYYRDLAVLSYNEVESDVKLQSVGMVSA